MKKFLTLLALGLSFSLNSQALTIDLVPSVSQLASGATLELQVQVSGLKTASANALGVYDVTLNYDSHHFALNNINWGDSNIGNQLDINHTGSLQLNNNGAGWLNLIEVSFDSAWDLETLQANSFTLFSVVFSALNAGTGVFSLTANALGDAYGNNLIVDTINTASVDVGSISVPEPSSYLLMMVGLFALGLIRVKTKSSQ